MNNGGIVGYRHIPFIHPVWVGKYDLKIEGCEIKQDGQLIGYFEEWQEGYEDEAYSRDLLSAGIRLVVRTDWIRGVMEETNYSMAIWTSEKRMKIDSWTKNVPSEISEKEQYSIYISNGPVNGQTIKNRQ